MKFLDFPPFVVDLRDGGEVNFRITCGKVENSGAVVFVLKDLFYERDRHVHPFKKAPDDLILPEQKRREILEMTERFLFFRKRNETVVFYRNDKVFLF